MDLTMTSNGSNSSQHFGLSCITGERNTDGLELSIKKDNSIMRMTNEPHFTVQRPSSRKVLASGFIGMEHKGIFYCHLKQGSNHHTTVTLISNYNKGKWLHGFVSVFGMRAERLYRVILFIFSKVTSNHRGSLFWLIKETRYTWQWKSRARNKEMSHGNLMVRDSQLRMFEVQF